jgi:hypothetical protein
MAVKEEGDGEEGPGVEEGGRVPARGRSGGDVARAASPCSAPRSLSTTNEEGRPGGRPSCCPGPWAKALPIYSLHRPFAPGGCFEPFVWQSLFPGELFAPGRSGGDGFAASALPEPIESAKAPARATAVIFFRMNLSFGGGIPPVGYPCSSAAVPRGHGLWVKSSIVLVGVRELLVRSPSQGEPILSIRKMRVISTGEGR